MTFIVCPLNLFLLLISKKFSCSHYFCYFLTIYLFCSLFLHFISQLFSRFLFFSTSLISPSFSYFSCLFPYYISTLLTCYLPPLLLLLTVSLYPSCPSCLSCSLIVLCALPLRILRRLKPWGRYTTLQTRNIKIDPFVHPCPPACSYPSMIGYRPALKSLPVH